ncbi:ATP-binding protein (plasmid) [Kribbella sp. CWNU-51]
MADTAAGRSPGLFGREAECAALDLTLSNARAGRSQVVVLRGEAGVGKTALLGYLDGKLEGWQIARATGVESEMELAYSGLHQLCAPMLERMDRLPAPQREALATVFGRSSGAPPDRFLVGLAVLSLLAEFAERRPVICVVDDAQWLDEVSAQVMGFVFRRLLAERVAVVCAARSPVGDEMVSGLPALVVRGLGESDSRALLLGTMHGSLDAAVLDRIIAESHGNPLALLELPRTWTSADLAGGYGLPDSTAVIGKIEHSYVRRLLRLPPDTQLLLLVAAADPTGDSVLLKTVAKGLGLDLAALDLAADVRLLKVDERVEFAHPLARAAAYRSATADDRRRVHRALAVATNVELDPDRRAWHLASAAAGPDEEVAAELERSAGRAQARGGFAAASAFLRRAVALTVDPARRSERALSAAQLSLTAGAFDAALRMLGVAEGGPLDDFQRARAELVRVTAGYTSGSLVDAPARLLDVAGRLEAFDLELARETYLYAWSAATSRGHFEQSNALMRIGRAIRALPPPESPRPFDLLLDGLARYTTDGRAAAIPALQTATKAVSDLPVTDVLRWGWAATCAPNAVWDEEGMFAVSTRQLELTRAAGALAELPIHLTSLSLAIMFTGDFVGAAALMAESDSVAAATGTRFAGHGLTRLLAWQGKEDEAVAVIAATMRQAEEWGQGIAVTAGLWGLAVLHNGLGRYAEAVAEAREAASHTFELWISMWVLPELVEAAVRTDDIALAIDAFERLDEATRPCGTDWALGIRARASALLSDGAAADDLYQEAIERLGRTRLRPELARAHLLYGEWLRRAGRRTDARKQLRTAEELLTTIGMTAFAERARRELAATGEKLRRRAGEQRAELTPQEEQIARLARDGRTNQEIGAELFLSPRTVEWHLRKVFDKLGITSRTALHTVMPGYEP